MRRYSNAVFEIMLLHGQVQLKSAEPPLMSSAVKVSKEPKLLFRSIVANVRLGGTW